MVRAIQERVTVGPAGRVIVDKTGLAEGSVADVILLVNDIAHQESPRPLSTFVGILRGQFHDATQADAHLEDLRKDWDRK
jgi:hypothetical protein